MALVVADRVQETTTTTGQGTVTLAGAAAGYQSFAAIGDGNTTYYTLTSGNNWEVGVGTYTSSGTTLARTTVLASSAGGTTKITLSGTSNAFVTYPAEIATMLTNPVATNGGVVYGTGTAINVSAAGTVNGYQFLQSAGAASPTWVQINSFKDVAVAPTSPTPIEGDRFFDNTTGIDYTYITDVDGSQWVETAPGNLASVAGGSSTQVQYNNAGILGGITGATTNGTVLTLTTPVLGVATGTSLALGGATLGSNALAVTGTASISGGAYISNLGGANKIINGDMAIDQRNAGASVVLASGVTYTVDRMAFQASQASKVTEGQDYGAVTPPAGFSHYLGMKVTTTVSLGASDYFQFWHKIEGLNCSDLNWGTANAKAVTLSFWVYCSTTGTFGGGLSNSGQSRSYPFAYVINVANTWELKTVTIAGDTTGTWLTTNGIGLSVFLGMGIGSTYSTTAGAWAAGTYVSATGATNLMGTLNAVFYVTGVKLEVGTVATPFVPDDYQVSLGKCFRYYENSFAPGTAPANAAASNYMVGICGANTSSVTTCHFFEVVKRATPTMTYYRGSNGGVSNGVWATYSSGFTSATSMVAETTGAKGFSVDSNRSAAFTVGSGYIVDGNWTADAEL
jgi:hypothetical protein